MNHCKICGALLLDTHYKIHDLTKEQYEERYGTEKYSPFRNYKQKAKKQVSECEKRDALRKFSTRAY